MFVTHGIGAMKTWIVEIGALNTPDLAIHLRPLGCGVYANLQIGKGKRSFTRFYRRVCRNHKPGGTGGGGTRSWRRVRIARGDGDQHFLPVRSQFEMHDALGQLLCLLVFLRPPVKNVGRSPLPRLLKEVEAIVSACGQAGIRGSRQRQWNDTALYAN